MPPKVHSVTKAGGRIYEVQQEAGFGESYLIKYIKRPAKSREEV